MITDTRETLTRDVLECVLLLLAFVAVLVWGPDLSDLLAGWWGR